MTEDLEVRWSGGHAIVRMPDELDLANAVKVDRRLAHLCHDASGVITIDLTGTTFCDSAGVQSLARAHRLATANGSELRLVVGASPVSRILQLTGVDQVLPIYHDVQHSLDTPRAGS
ncbi:MAG TPA: STAS domain-containing protein [Streptosporangiaceae bacterium]|nr:STAS domain-containing protein [Streptosporangiaceae bacterium]